MAFINQASQLNVKFELDIFKTFPVQTGIESSSLQTKRPINSLAYAEPIEFVVSGSSNDEYLDLARVYLSIKAKITVQTPAATTATPNPVAPIVGPTNNWLHSMISQADIYLNQKCITPPLAYNYRAYIENLLNYSNEAKKSHLTCGVWADDTAGHMDNVNANNVGFTTRRALTSANKTVDLFGPLHCDLSKPLHCDLFNVDTYLLNGVEMTVTLHRAKDEFHLMGATNATAVFEILEAELYLRKVKINSAVLIAHHTALKTATAEIPITRVDVKSLIIAAGTQSKVLDNLYIGTLPKRCIIGFVESTAFNGNLQQNPYNFQNFNYTHLGVYLDSVAVPARPFICDFPNGQYIRAYQSLFEGCNINHCVRFILFWYERFQKCLNYKIQLYNT